MRFVLPCLLWVVFATSSFAQPPSDDWPSLLSDAEASGAVRVMVQLRAPVAPEGALSAPEALAQRASIAQQQEAVASSLGENKTLQRFRYIPYLALSASPEDLEMLASSPLVVKIQRDMAVPMLGGSERLEESTAIIGAPEAWVRGFDGTGFEVAILDTGVEAEHPFLAGKVVAEACFSSTTSEDGYTSFSLCPNGEETQIGPGAGAACDFTGGCSHGTSVAGIAAGAGEEASGVAPGAGIISIQVNSRFTEGCSGECGLTWYSDHLEALEHVYSLVVEEGRPIVAANLSFGGGSYTAVCDEEVPAMHDAIENLWSVGVATVIASGNSREMDATTYPGCISNAVTVGATTEEDAIWARSNVAPWMDLLAPGTGILTSTTGGGYGVSNGTSMATPHVVGAWAILRQRYPEDGVDQTLARLQASGVGIAAGMPQAMYPRIQIDAALDAPRLAWAPGAVTQVLAPGTAASRTITVTNSTEPGSPDLTWTAAFESAVSWASVVLPDTPLAPEASGDVTLAFDAAGLTSGAYSASLVLSSSDPTAASVTVPVTLLVGAQAEPRTISGTAGWRLVAPAAPGVTVDDFAAMNLVSGMPGYYPENEYPNLYSGYTGSRYTPLAAGDVLATGAGVWWYLYDLNFNDGGPSNSYALPATLATLREPLATDAEVEIHARGSRWNLLGNPFGTSLSLANVRDWPGARTTLGSYTGVTYDSASNSWVLTTTETVIEPWEGFMLYGRTPGTLTIPASAQASGDPLQDDRVFLALELSETPEAQGAGASGAKRLADRGAVLYFDASAELQEDDLDVPQLEPMDNRYVMAAFVSPDGARLRAQEARAMLSAGEKVQVNVAVAAVGSGTALRLTWPSLARLPAEWEAHLHDTATGATVNMRDEEGYSFEVQPAQAAKRSTALAPPALASASVHAFDGAEARFQLTVSHGLITASSPRASGALALDAPVPNPARGAATVRYALPAAGPVRLDVVDLLGRRVASLAEGEVPAGPQVASFDVGGLAAGVYAVRLQSGEAVRVVRLTVVR